MVGRNGPAGGIARRHGNAVDEGQIIAQRPIGGEIGAGQGLGRIADHRRDRLAGSGIFRGLGDGIGLHGCVRFL